MDPEDGLDHMEIITTGASDKELSNILGEDKGGLAYWVACIRECFEEAGILIAYREDGSLLTLLILKKEKGSWITEIDLMPVKQSWKICVKKKI